ncbi:integrase core domain-containing protein [Xylanimonas ulmi]|uniref:Transposase InsO family protein n=1 Tax=Xylanimonas ulmi TaxID=228973 RepID=A0A4Q7M049_9MICO|nr:integrase core domain-containing protein [Xylanibacterium ulmi]RZS60694.1 transposase InsO family protein [Xylanibacterium ulmi]
MDFNHVPADVRWAIANWPEDAERGAVTRFCERHEISRSVFYKIRRLALEVGPVGATEPGSRRPHASPTRTDEGVVEHAIAVRAWLVEQGLDAGPLSVRARMRRQGLNPPSRATLARAFAAAGVSRPEPRKRPRAANRRFVYPAPNCCWQIDAFTWSLADGTTVAVHQVIDDHSRMAVGTLVADGETAKAAVQVVSTAIRRWGVPQRLLSDNGLASGPTRRGFTGKLVDYLIDLGVKPITGKPDKPTTQGKNERFHQTLQKWLNARPPAKTIAGLQALVDEFDAYYNHERAHQAIDGLTPAEAWAATAPAPEPTPQPRMPPVPPRAARPPAVISPSTIDPNPPAPGPAASPVRRPRLTRPGPEGAADARVRTNGQVTMLGCLFYISTDRAGQSVRVVWNTSTIEFLTHDGESLTHYPRPTSTGWYYGPRNPDGFPLASIPQTPTAGAPDAVERTVSKGGYVGALGCKFYASTTRQGQKVTLAWSQDTVTITDTTGAEIYRYARPTQTGTWHGPRQPPTKS